jgi:hypothetical protein
LFQILATMDKDEAVKRFRDMPQEKQQRLYDSMARLFSKLEADWKAKPENACKTIKYTELWEDHIKKMKESGGGAGEATSFIKWRVAYTEADLAAFRDPMRTNAYFGCHCPSMGGFSPSR